MPSVSIIYRKDKVNKKEASPIHLRIIKDRKISYISTGISVTEDCCDERHCRINQNIKIMLVSIHLFLTSSVN